MSSCKDYVLDAVCGKSLKRWLREAIGVQCHVTGATPELAAVRQVAWLNRPFISGLCVVFSLYETWHLIDVD